MQGEGFQPEWGGSLFLRLVGEATRLRREEVPVPKPSLAPKPSMAPKPRRVE